MITITVREMLFRIASYSIVIIRCDTRDIGNFEFYGYKDAVPVWMLNREISFISATRCGEIILQVY